MAKASIRVVVGQLTFIERLFIYHFMPGSVVLWVALQWDAPEGPLKLMGGEGRPMTAEQLERRAEKYNVKVFVFDGPLPYEFAEQLLNDGYFVAVRYEGPLELPKGTALLLQPRDVNDVKEALKSYDDVHLELYVPSESFAEDLPKDLPLHTFNWKIYNALLRKGYHYVYHHEYPLREDTKCPKCGVPNAVREQGKLLGWDGPRCRKCGYQMHYHYADLPKVPKSVIEWLDWHHAVVVV